MGRAHRRNPPRMTRACKPVAKRGMDDPAATAFARSAAGDQKDHARALGNRTLEAVIERGMGCGQRMAMQIDHHLGDNPAPPQRAIPAPVEGAARRARGHRRLRDRS